VVIAADHQLRLAGYQAEAPGRASVPAGQVQDMPERSILAKNGRPCPVGWCEGVARAALISRQQILSKTLHRGLTQIADVGYTTDLC
jgi:hypothetical protein